MKRTYEILYIINPAVNENEVVEKLNSVITANGGDIKNSDVWGLKRLAYDIRGIEEGVFVLVVFDAESACVKEIDRVMRINENILRHMVTEKER